MREWIKSSGGGLALGFGVAVFLAAAVISFGLLLCFKPLLARYALAKPNARSSHKTPTPQGGGIAVIAATMIVIAAMEIFLPRQADEPFRLVVVLVSAVGLALVGAADDVWPMEAVPRLLLQAAAVATVIATLPYDMRIVPAFPWWLDRAVLLVGGVWLVNVVNFMDGIDWMTVAEIVPLMAGLALFGLMGGLPHDATLIALALCGAVIGFAPFNRPVAQLFMGDVGTLPIGLLLGWLLMLLAGRGYFAAAVLLPLYYLADATVTLLRRLVNGESVTQAHRSHFYQRALDGGFSVYQIVARVFAINIVLVMLGLLTVMNKSLALDLIMCAMGTILVGTLIWKFNRAAPKTQ